MKTKQLLLSLLALLVSVMVHAYDFKVNGIYYNIYSSTNKTAQVTYQSYVSTKNGGSVPNGYYYETYYNIIGYDDDDCAIYGNPASWNFYYTSDYSGSITIPSTVTYNGTTYQVTSIDYGAFHNCSATSVTIPSSITRMGDEVFRNYKGSLTINCDITNFTHDDEDGDVWGPFVYGSFSSVTLGNNVNNIPIYTFLGCNSLKTISLSNSTSVSNCAFEWNGGSNQINTVNVKYSDYSALSTNNNLVDKFSASVTWNYYINNNLVTSLNNIPNSVTRIGNGAFYKANGLTSVSIPSNITAIGSNAFKNCSNLAVIDINATSLTSIGSDAFLGCTKLKTVNLNSIANWLNCSLSNSTASPFSNGADLYVADEEKTTISFPVATTSIPAYAFYGCSNITSVTIPAQVSSIGTQAFGNCPLLTSFNINPGNSYLCLQDGILYNANKTILMSYIFPPSGVLVIPETVTEIQESALIGCTGLTSINIPNSVTSIGASAFSGCKGTLTVNCNIPDASNSSSSPFNGSSFSSVIFGDNVSSIGKYAFYNARNISVTVPYTLSSIGNYAFYDYSGGVSSVRVKISDFSKISTNSILHSYLPASATWYYYINNELITTLNIPSSVTSIGSWAFYNAKNITSLTLPSTLTSIGSSAFSGCSGIASVTLPSSLTSIGSSAFSGCSGSLTVNCNIPDGNYNSFTFNGSSFSSVTFGNNVTSIGNYAFNNRSSIKSITLPYTFAASVGTNAFSGCSGITTVNVKISDISCISSNRTIPSFLPSTATWNYFLNDNLLTSIDIPSSITVIGDNAFYNAKGITSLTFPASLTSIGSSAFYNCTGINTVTLPYTFAASVGTNAFSGCSGITTVNTKISDISSISSNRTIPSFLPSTATWNYYLNDNLLTSLDIPSSVTTIGQYAFYNAKGLNSITIPASMTSIGSYAFSLCSPTAFICKATNPPSLGNNNAFGGQKKIYVPYASMDTYKSAWSQLSTSTYTYLPLLDVMFFDTQSADSYAAELNGKDKNSITSVAFYEGGIDGTLTEEVMKNGMNPNCLYYVPASASLTGDNIVTLDDYEAESVTLTDNYTYDCPIPFRAETIKYVHNPSVWANGSSGWETICLPFEPESFTASERGYISPIMLGSKGNFWLRKFVGASSDAVYFTSTLDGKMEANTPYLIAFPGSTMGTGHLEGQTITFEGHDADIEVTQQPEVQNNDFVFVGNFDTTADGIEGWALNAAGNSFTRNNNVGNQPFRAYFKNVSGDASNARLRISFSDPTDISSLILSSEISYRVMGEGQLLIHSETDTTKCIYSIDGRLVRRVHLTAGENRISGLQKGMYIIDNVKMMIR